MTCTARTLLIVMAATLTYPLAALAYLDPGTGSLILHSAIAAIVGAVVVVKVYWYRLKAFFSSKNPGNDDEPDEQATLKRKENG